jgi:hypothetical protein
LGKYALAAICPYCGGKLEQAEWDMSLEPFILQDLLGLAALTFFYYHCVTCDRYIIIDTFQVW